MIATIDKAGRIVVPKELRERLNLVAGTPLEVALSGTGITLRKVTDEPSLVRKDGVLVHHGAGDSDLDVAAFIRAERESRSALRAE